MARPKSEALQILLVAYVPFIILSKWGLPHWITVFFLAHPWEMILGIFTLPMVTMLYTEPQSSLRLAVLPLIAAGVICYHATSPSFMLNRTIASGFDGPHMLLFLTAVDALVLRRLYLGKDGKEKSHNNNDDEAGEAKENSPRWMDGSDNDGISTWKAWGWAAHVIFSYRAIGTPRVAKNVPEFPGKQPPSWSSFLSRKAFSIIIAYLFVDFLNQQPPPSPEMYAARKAVLFLPPLEWTMETVLVRIISTLLFWLILRVTIGLIYNIAAFAGVATFLTEPADWPPYFGSLAEAFSLRKFWA